MDVPTNIRMTLRYFKKMFPQMQWFIIIDNNVIQSLGISNVRELN